MLHNGSFSQTTRHHFHRSVVYDHEANDPDFKILRRAVAAYLFFEVRHSTKKSA